MSLILDIMFKESQCIGVITNMLSTNRMFCYENLKRKPVAVISSVNFINFIVLLVH